MAQDQVPNVATPAPALNKSVMAPVGDPTAPQHLSKPMGIPSGPTANDLMTQIAQMKEQIDRLMAVSTPATPDVRAEKTYYHTTEGSNIVISRRGKHGESMPEVHHFFGGKLVTADPVLQDFLDEIVDKSGVPIYSRKPGDHNPEADAAAKMIVENAQKAIDKMGSEASKK